MESTAYTEYEESESQRKAAKLEEFCEHMKALIEFCKETSVSFGGCGDCGSAWLTCNICKTEVLEAHEAF